MTREPNRLHEAAEPAEGHRGRGGGTSGQARSLRPTAAAHSAVPGPGALGGLDRGPSLSPPSPPYPGCLCRRCLAVGGGGWSADSTGESGWEASECCHVRLRAPSVRPCSPETRRSDRKRLRALPSPPRGPTAPPDPCTDATRHALRSGDDVYRPGDGRPKPCATEGQPGWALPTHARAHTHTRVHMHTHEARAGAHMHTQSTCACTSTCVCTVCVHAHLSVRAHGCVGVRVGVGAHTCECVCTTASSTAGFALHPPCE